MLNNYITKIHNVDQAELESYIFYNMSGGISYCPKAKFKEFSRVWTRTSHDNVRLAMDLCSAQSHTLFFDLDCNKNVSEKMLPVVFKAFQSVLKVLLLPHVHNFTMLISTRPQSSGIHVHLPEFAICHDDYILLCEQLQPQFHRGFQTDRHEQFEYKLDIPVNFSLTHSSKPGTTTHYQPCQVVYVEEGKSVTLDCHQKPFPIEEIRRNFKRCKINVNSFFRKMILLEELDLRYTLLEFMMPVATPYDPLWKLSFQTDIAMQGEEKVVDDAGDVVAELAFRQNPDIGHVRKGGRLRFDGTHWLKTYHYLRFNSYLMVKFQSNNRALRTWYDRISRLAGQQVSDGGGNPVFRAINELLKADNYRLQNDINPLKSVLEYDQGYYFLPTFYALTQHLNLRSSELVQHLRGTIDHQFHDMLDKIERVSDQHMDLAAKQFTLDTIMFCSHNMYPRPILLKDKLSRIFQEMKRQILSASYKNSVVEALKTMMDRHFPIMVFTLAFSVKKPIRYMWNALCESWQEVGSPQDVSQLVATVWDSLKRYVENYPKDTRLCTNEILESVTLTPIVSTILSESNMQRRLIQMDRHKWLIRTPDGTTLDLLTRHVGGTVPEHFISERKMGVRLDRNEMTYFHDPSKSAEFWRLYRELVSKRFFYKYLKACLCDATDDLTETLRELVTKELKLGSLLVYQPRAESVLQFYVHLCKYATFDYDTMMYLLDVLASLFVATNYARKIFILKGVTKNGKSKLFQIIQRVYGGYCAIIRPDNIRPSTSSLGPMPELASNLFSCRIVVLDEIGGKLNENLIKEITGNSTVSFRNMYEQN